MRVVEGNAAAPVRKFSVVEANISNPRFRLHLKGFQWTVGTSARKGELLHRQDLPEVIEKEDAQERPCFAWRCLLLVSNSSNDMILFEVGLNPVVAVISPMGCPVTSVSGKRITCFK